MNEFPAVPAPVSGSVADGFPAVPPPDSNPLPAVATLSASHAVKTEPSVPPSPVRPYTARRRQTLRFALVTVAIACLFGAGWAIFLKPSPPPVIPPLPETDDHMFAAAMQEAHELLRQDPWSAAKWGEMGRLLIGNGFIKESNAFFVQAEKLDPEEPRWPYFQGLICRRDNAAEAVVMFERSAPKFMDTISPLCTLADAYLAAGRVEDAKKQFTLILQVHPNHGRALLGLGRVALDREEYADAETYLIKAAGQTWTQKAACRLLHLIYKLENRQAEAERALRIYMSIDANEDIEDPVLADAQRMMMGKKLYLLRIDELTKARKLDEAVQFSRAYVQDYPDDTGAQGVLGRALVLRSLDAADRKLIFDDFEEAQRLLEKHTLVDADRDEAWSLLGALYKLRFIVHRQPQDLVRAKDYLEKAVNNGYRTALPYFALAECHKMEQNIPAAASVLKKFAQRRPNLMPRAGFVLLADLQVMTGKPLEAYGNYANALRIEGSNDGGCLEKMLVLSLQFRFQP